MKNYWPRIGEKMEIQNGKASFWRSFYPEVVCYSRRGEGGSAVFGQPHGTSETEIGVCGLMSGTSGKPLCWGPEGLGIREPEVNYHHRN